MIDDDIIKTKLAVLEMRFNKIEPTEYYLSYSGGNDSHLLFWYIKENNLPIKIIGLNTRIEHSEIRKRIYDNSDDVIYPIMKPFDIKKKYGIPCFSKEQDQFIHSYQEGGRTKSTMEKIFGDGDYTISKTARNLLLSGKLHPISSKCCTYTKKIPFRRFESKYKLKPIIGVRQNESVLRNQCYNTCLDSKGKFSPLFDFSNDVMSAIREKHSIEIPKVYDCGLTRTGCYGCPYSIYGKETMTALNLLTPNQREFATNLFKESYDVRGVDYNQIMFK